MSLTLVPTPATLRIRVFPALLLAVALFASACGGDGVSDVELSNGTTEQGEFESQPQQVEPDGGIGDGAGPIPGAEDSGNDDEGTWHGAEVAVANCPGTDWMRVDGSAFSFSIPVDFVEQEVQGVDSEIGQWLGGNGVEVFYDYGPFSGSLAGRPGAETESVDFGGISGERTVLRSGDLLGVDILFPQVEPAAGDQWNRLGMLVTITDLGDEIIGRCVVDSIEWG